MTTSNAQGQGQGSQPRGGQVDQSSRSEDGREPRSTPQQRAEATVADITLESPSLAAGTGSVQSLPATYTCDGSNRWPTLTWSGVPPGSTELALLLVNTQPVDEKLFFDWAVAGIDPGLTSIESGRLPKGAVLGRNGFGASGYSLCPPKGSSETYFFTLYALPKKLGMRPGFDPLALREAALDASHNVGLLPVTYSRP